MRIMRLLLLILASTTFAAPVQEVRIDPQSPGRIFEGIGALSAGASSRLLIDYPEPQRSEILDLLFKPKYGASLHHLKVEIGGGVNSTDGSEPSHAYTRGEFDNPKDEYFQRGYEWWLMKEAKKRNPDIILDTLMWGAPAWTGNNNTPYSQAGADYVVAFIKGAKKHHDLTIDYTGIWNERMYDAEWIKLLRRTLDAAGLSGVGIVAADQVGNHIWTIVEGMMRDDKFMDAVAVVGEHYSSQNSQGGTTPLAVACEKRLWSSEDSTGGGAWPGCAGMAQRFNGNYIKGKMTKTIVWSLISSYYDNLMFPGSGPMRASEPWSGHYDPQDGIWIIAHTTQFTAPGWQYLDEACGLLRAGGTFVTLKSPGERNDFSIIIETMGAKEKQEVRFELAQGSATKRLHVWRSNAKKRFRRMRDIRKRKESFSITLDPDSIYSLTTTTGQRKAKVSPPPAKPFPFPYSDDFEKASANRMPHYFSDQYGAFEVIDRPGGRGKCLGQLVTEVNVPWRTEQSPSTWGGDPAWEDYVVSVDGMLTETGHISLAGRVGTVGDWTGSPFNAVVLEINEAGAWTLVAAGRELAAGTVPFGLNEWHLLELAFHGYGCRAYVDGTEIARALSLPCVKGMIALGSGRNHACFDNVSIRKLPEKIATAASIDNIARGATATASSTWAEKQWTGDYSARQAKDGDRTGTRWNAGAGKTAGEWLKLDFGRPETFDTVIVTEYGDRIARYRIQVFKGAKWRDVASGLKIGATPKMSSFSPVTARKLRLFVDETSGSSPSIYELEVFNSSVQK